MHSYINNLVYLKKYTIVTNTTRDICWTKSNWSSVLTLQAPLIPYQFLIESLTLFKLTRYCDESLMKEYLFSKLKLRCFHLNFGNTELTNSFIRHLLPDFIEEISLKNVGFDAKIVASVST